MVSPPSPKPNVHALTKPDDFIDRDPTPFSAAFALGKRHASRGVAIGIFGTLLLHGGIGAYGLSASYDLGDFARSIRSRLQSSLHATIDIDVQKEPEPPPPAPPTEVPAPAPVEKAPPPAVKAPPPAPAAAQAAKVLTAKADPDEPVDLTGTTFVTGNAESYAGGVTASDGTSKDAVYNRNAQANGSPGGTGKGPAQPAVDRSAPVRLVSTDWQCPFPEEADIEQINYTRVPVLVSVEADGRAKSVQVLKDPGYGFARQAKSCALRQTYKPALDKDGNPIAQTVGPINITFTR